MRTTDVVIQRNSLAKGSNLWRDLLILRRCGNTAVCLSSQTAQDCDIQSDYTDKTHVSHHDIVIVHLMCPSCLFILVYFAFGDNFISLLSALFLHTKTMAV